MDNCECPKLPNGTYRRECVNGKCKNCKKLPFPKLVSEDTCPDDHITFSQFDLSKTPYTKKDKITDELVGKVLKTERVHHTLTFVDALNSLIH